MGKSSPSAPTPPDPKTTAEAQTASNKETALYNFGLNNPNTYSTLGSSTFTQTGGGPTYNQVAYDSALKAWQASSAADAANAGKKGYKPVSGAMPTLDQFKTGETSPQVRQDIKLSPEQQKLYDQQTQQSIGLSNLANQLQGRVGGTLNQPLPTSADINALSENAQNAYYKNQTKFLDPQFQQGQQQLDAKLANQGITLGSEAYNNDQNNFARQKQSAYDTAQQNAILQGPQNAQQLFSLNSAQRQQPLNEFNALRTGSQVQMPQFGGVNGVQAAGTNTAQIAQNAYQGQLNNYNQQVGSNNAAMGGLFSLGGSLGAAAIANPGVFSDVRLKTNIERIGSTKSGIPVYRYKYKGSDTKHIGVMAQDVPHARVMMPGGFYAVDYSKVH